MFLTKTQLTTRNFAALEPLGYYVICCFLNGHDRSCNVVKSTSLLLRDCKPPRHNILTTWLILLVKTVLTLRDMDPFRPLSVCCGNRDQEISSRWLYYISLNRIQLHSKKNGKFRTQVHVYICAGCGTFQPMRWRSEKIDLFDEITVFVKEVIWSFEKRLQPMN